MTGDARNGSQKYANSLCARWIIVIGKQPLCGMDRCNEQRAFVTFVSRAVVMKK